MKKLFGLLSFLLIGFGSTMAMYTPTPDLEAKVEKVSVALIQIADTKLDGNYDALLTILKKFQTKVTGNEKKEWIIDSLIWNIMEKTSWDMMKDDMMDDKMMKDDDMMKKDEMMKDKEMMKDWVTFEIWGRNFAFSQNEIIVHEGDTVTINFTSNSWFHDWVVDEFDAATKQVSTGESTSVTFVADKAWSFEYYCSVGSHRSQWMVGTLIVKERMADHMMKNDKMMDEKMMKDSVALKNVVGTKAIRWISFNGNETGMGSLSEKDWATHVYASFSNIANPWTENFYEGWIVRKSPLSVVSTGELELKDGKWVNHFTSTEIDDHRFYVLTLEPNDWDPAPADHIFEWDL